MVAGKRLILVGRSTPKETSQIGNIQSEIESRLFEQQLRVSALCSTILQEAFGSAYLTLVSAPCEAWGYMSMTVAVLPSFTKRTRTTTYLFRRTLVAVSYTHLTLPTILLV